MTRNVEAHAVAAPRALVGERAARISSPWAVAAIVAAFYTLLMAPGLVGNPYQFINIGRHFHVRATSSPVINRARTIDHKIGYDGQFYYFLAADPSHGRDYMDSPGFIYSRIGYPMTVRALSGGNATLIPYVMVLVNILAAVGGTLAIAFILVRRGLPPALAFLYGFFPGLVLSVLRDLTEPMAFGLAAAGLLVFTPRSKLRLLGSASLFGLAMLTRETVALFPAIVAIGLLVGMGTASTWRDRFRWRNLARAVAFAELAFAPLYIWRHVVTTYVLPNVTTQESYGGTPHVVSGTAGRVIAGLVPFHAMAAQWPWSGEHVTNLLTVVLPALMWAGLAIALLRRKLTPEPWFVLANVAVFVVFLPDPIAVDYGSMGRASIGVVLAALLTLPQLLSSLPERARLARGALALWSLPFWLLVAILFGGIGPRFIW
jgi:hypothetical protein